MKDRKYYDHVDMEYYTECAEGVLEMDTDQVERFAKELLNIVAERRKIERNKEIQCHLTTIADHIQALHKMGLTVEIEDEEHSASFYPDPDFPPIVSANEYK